MNRGSTMQLNVKESLSADVIVAGAGASGIVAAVAAAREGAEVLVLERHGFPGGAWTAMGVGPMMGFHNRAGRQLVGGIAQEIVDRLMDEGASPGHIPDSITYCSTVTPFDSEAMKTVLETMLAESGARIRYHSVLADTVTENGLIESVIAAGKGGLERFRATAFVDATGDAELAFLSGASCTKGREGDNATQPMTMNLKLGNVDSARIRDYAIANPDNFHFTFGAEQGIARLKTTPRISLAGYLSQWNEALVSGELTIPRDLVLFFETATEGVFIMNTTRVQGLDPADPDDISRAEKEGREQCRELFRFLKAHCPGFENAVNLGSPSHIGIRESRHIVGQYLLTAEDLVAAREFPDTIARGGYPIDIHSPDKVQTNSTHLSPEAAYSIPMRSLIAGTPSNLLAAGRALGANHEALAAVRISPVAMATGQACGVIAALASKTGGEIGNVDYEDVRKALLEGSAIL